MMNHKPTEPLTHCYVDGTLCEGQGTDEKCHDCTALRRHVMRATNPFPSVSEMEMTVIKRISVLEEALHAAANSLQTIAGAYNGKGGLEDLVDVRQYAASRAMMAKKALEEK